MSHPTTTDPRPHVAKGPDGQLHVDGRHCRSCGEVSALAWPRCPACRGTVEPAAFGPDGTVWCSTIVRIPVPGRTPPYALAYVDLDDGPRVLAHVTDDGVPVDEPVLIGSRVRLAGLSLDGDLRVELLR
ncbi:Zn-ribbon domain-containing OB-fold protein [Pseudonocardia sp. GCM10023141]|uniref:Zn-ribbon domain-containing OB-fold protein n=1 Tax=Pseudonocardia sp. GCM10023141 TaxID=3252653 RepID=UPI00362320B1